MVTGETYRKDEKYGATCPISIYDVAAVETWLEDQAAAGYRPVGFRGERACFVPAEPARCRFRMEPARRRKEPRDPEKEEVYGALGWQLVGALGPFWVWRCDDPAAPELDTDPVVQGEGYRYLRRRMLRRAVALSLVCLALLGEIVWMTFAADLGTVLARSSTLQVLGRPVIGAVLLAAILIEVVLDARNTRRLWRTLRAGVPLERPKPYRRQLWAGRVTYIACLAALALNLAVNAQNLGNHYSGWEHAERMSLAAGEPLPPGLPDLSVLDGTVGHQEASVWEKSLPVAPEMVSVEQWTPLPDGGRVHMAAERYRLAGEGLAQRLAEELTENRGGFFDSRPELPLEPVEGTEDFWWAREVLDYPAVPAGREEEQFAVLRRGTVVLAVRYTGAADLREAGAYLAELLEN